ncbi:phosphate/phosphite/phosphonate ABC transporter substrate-binding protein [Thermodesulfobacteriota bacterium]
MRSISLPKNNILRSFIAFLLFCFISSAAMPVIVFGQTSELLIGIEPEHNIFEQMKRYRYIAEYLSDQLGVKVKLTIMSRYGEVIKRFKTLKLDGAFLTSYTATLGIKELNLAPIVNPVNLKGEVTSQGYIFVRKDSGIRSVSDMENGNIVFVDPATMEGYLFPLAFLEQHGVKEMNKFFHRYYFSGSHESAIFAVLDGRADIGSAKSTVYNNLVNNDPSVGQELEIIARSPKVPEVTLCIKSEIDQDLRERLRSVLIQMDRTDYGMKVLKQFNAKRFVESNKEDFSIIEKMAQKALGALTVHGK